MESFMEVGQGPNWGLQRQGEKKEQGTETAGERQPVLTPASKKFNII
jgi:hypothetical protein